MRTLPLRHVWAQAALFVGVTAFVRAPSQTIAHRIVDPTTERISLHWKAGDGKIHGNLGALRASLEKTGEQLLFGMNGGMYTSTQTPVGLYVEDGRLLQRIDRRTDPQDNFHMQPNGVFGLYTDGRAFVKTTKQLEHIRGVSYATQSGPMLLVNGTVNGHFTPGSTNLHIRNGVGLLPDGRVVFAISRVPMNFHDFATWFAQQGCRDALYLDGFVSKVYFPEQGLMDLDGELGVLVAVTAR